MSGNTCPKSKPWRLTVNENVGCFDSQHGSLICMKTSETERWQNGKMERTAAKNIRY